MTIERGPGERPLVSAILTTYGRPDLLHEALDSVYAQDGQGKIFDLEAVVVDDASPNDARAIVARYPALYVRHPENRGVAAALNTGIAATRGVYVAFLDDDDVWLPGKLRAQVPVLEAHPDVGAVYGGSRARPHWTGPSGRIFEELLTWNFVGYFTVLARRTALARVGYLDETLRSNEDYDLWLRLAYHFPFTFVPGATGIYRPSPQGLFQSKIATGASRHLLRRVIDKALAMAPELSDETAQRIRMQMERKNFADLLLLPPEAALSQMLAHLRECPAIAEDPVVCRGFARVIRLQALASGSAVESARRICATLQENAGQGRARRLLAAVWAELALGLLSAGRGLTAISAGSTALRHDPGTVVQRGLGWVRRMTRGPRAPVEESTAR